MACPLLASEDRYSNESVHHDSHWRWKNQNNRHSNRYTPYPSSSYSNTDEPSAASSSAAPSTQANLLDRIQRQEKKYAKLHDAFSEQARILRRMEKTLKMHNLALGSIESISDN